jgi:hypothetical protein
LLRRRPASKKPNAGIIIITKPVETSTQEVFPAFRSDNYIIVQQIDQIFI